jgi:hypothetical protein
MDLRTNRITANRNGNGEAESGRRRAHVCFKMKNVGSLDASMDTPRYKVMRRR